MISNSDLAPLPGIIPTDRDGKLLRITSLCDLNKVLTEFKQCMERNGHGAIMDINADSKPIRPVDCFYRRTHGPPGMGDDRKIDAFNLQQRHWSRSCNVVVPALLKLMDKDPDILEELKLLNAEDISISTQKN